MSWIDSQVDEAHSKVKQITAEFMAEGHPEKSAREAAISIVQMEFATRKVLQDAVIKMSTTPEYQAMNMDEKMLAIDAKVVEAAENRLEELIAPATAAVNNARDHVKSEFRKRLEQILMGDS